MEIYRLKVKQIQLSSYLMDIYTEDKLELPRRAPYIVGCQKHLFDYLDISCEPPKSFFDGVGNSYFLLFSISLSKDNCETFGKFLKEHGSTTFDISYQVEPRRRKRRQAAARNSTRFTKNLTKKLQSNVKNLEVYPTECFWKL